MRLARWSVIVYLVLLGASHLVRRLPEAHPATSTDLHLIEAPIYPVDKGPVRKVRLAYREWSLDAGRSDLPVVLLIHGSPGNSSDFSKLGPQLGRDFRMLAPDLPGFGASEADVPDYSIRAHAAYLLTLLEALKIESVHVVGFSMGGGVALEMIDRSPAPIRSLTLLSAIGVQELELLGDYHLNHAIHGLQLGLLWFCREAVPHFGALDHTMLSVEYGRNFYDTDQRPLRAILQGLEVPTLIIHGSRDILVPVAAAREHHRIVPQSEIALFDANHFMIFRGDSDLAPTIGDFIDRVEAGQARNRAESSTARLEAASRPFDARIVPKATGVALIVLFCLIALATLITEDIACIGAGLLVAQGRIGFLAATLACFVGIVLGDVLLYWAGRSLGYPWLKRAPLKWFITKDQIDRASEWFNRRGSAVVFLTRFIPGTRVAAYTTAGLLRTSFWRFLLYFTLAVAIWTPFLVGVAAYFGNRVLEHFELFQRYTLPAVVALLALLWLVAKMLPLISTWRGRRRLRGYLCRIRHWEFWPLWAFYPPVLIWIGWLAVRYRSLTLFTAANPTIPGGGFVGESKNDILRQLDPQFVAIFNLVPADLDFEDRKETVRSFAARHQLDLPLVLKPDVGQRGQGVCIAKDWATVDAYCENAASDFLVQRFVPGPEFGVFYFRRPDQSTGRVFSITVKELPQIEGDGRSTIEELILRDTRAVCMASFYLAQLGARCHEVPAAGESIPLAELGTHCRGAIFLDGTDLCTPELEASIDRISHSIEGFFFGRYDVRVPSVEALTAGKDIQVVELNGVTSEATDIYDPRNSILDAYKKLFAQWSLAFEIGELNRRRGIDPAGIRFVLRSLLEYRSSQ